MMSSQEVTAPPPAAAVDTSSAAALESDPDERKDTEPEDTVGLTNLFCLLWQCGFIKTQP